MATKTFGAVAGNWSDDTKWEEGSKPAATDDVVFDSGSANCVVNEATAALNSFDCTGYTGTLSGTYDITVTVASGTSTVLFAGTSPTWSGILNLNPAAGTTINLTFGTLTVANTCGGITIAGTTTGIVNMLDDIFIGKNKNVTLTSGTLHTDGATDDAGLSHNWGKFVGTGTTAKTMYLGNSTITLSSIGGTQWGDTSTLTLYKGTSTVVFSGTNVYCNLLKSYYTFSFTGSTVATINATCSFVNLYRVGTAAVNGQFQIDGGTPTVTGELKIQGNRISNRILCNTLPFTLTGIFCSPGATISNCQNVDFRNIQFNNGGANVDLSSITGGVGGWGGDGMS